MSSVLRSDAVSGLMELYEKLLIETISFGETVCILQKMMEILVNSEIKISCGAKQLSITPTHVEAYYWNSKNRWFDGYVHHNPAQEGRKGADFCHLYLHRLPRTIGAFDIRNGLDLVVGDQESVFLSFLIRESIGDGIRMNIPVLAQKVSELFAVGDYSCPGCSVDLKIRDEISPVDYCMRRIERGNAIGPQCDANMLTVLNRAECFAEPYRVLPLGCHVATPKMKETPHP